MLTAKIDERKLQSDLRKVAKAFGESGNQGVARWSIQVCREMARQTKVWGTDKGKSLGKQVGAIRKDAKNVVMIVSGLNLPNAGRRVITSASALNDWIDANRTRRGSRTAKLPEEEKKICTSDVFEAAMRIRVAKAGMAKGAWIGAGMDIAMRQTGTGKINIGKNYISWAHRHKTHGRGTVQKSTWSPSATMANNLRYASDKSVLSDARIKRAVLWGLKNTIKWYEKATEAKLKKNDR